MATAVTIAGYLAFFASVGFVFVLVNLVVGSFVRPANPYEEKSEIYECGEPTIGSSFVQFDLRFYVVALVFIIFDVEVAFLFPWAAVYGKVNNLRQPGMAITATDETGQLVLSDEAAGVYRELGVAEPALTPSQLASGDAAAEVRADATKLAMLATWGIGIFFSVLLIGLAYEWATGALDWVRAIRSEYHQTDLTRGSPPTKEGARQESVLSV